MVVFFPPNENLSLKTNCFSCVLDCPSTLAKHFAHLFIRDPLYVTDEQICENKHSKTTKYAFEVIHYI